MSSFLMSTLLKNEKNIVFNQSIALSQLNFWSIDLASYISGDWQLL